jgi:hypothetical protein
VNDAALDVGTVDVDGAVVVFCGELGVVAEDRGDVGKVVLGLDQAFSRVKRLGAGELVAVSFEGVCDSVEQGTALSG